MQIKRAFTKEQSRRKVVEEKHRKIFIVGLPDEIVESKFFKKKIFKIFF